MSTTTTINISERVDALDWDQLREQLDTQGHAVTEPLLRKGETRDLAGLFDDEKRFARRSTWPATASAMGVTDISTTAARRDR
jgi:hypothetical protein